MLEERLELGPERGISLRRFVLAVERFQRRHQRFGDVAAAVGAEATGGPASSEIGHGTPGVRNAECGMRSGPCVRRVLWQVLGSGPALQFRIPHSALRN